LSHKKTIPGLRKKAKELNAQLGKITKDELLAILVVVAVIIFQALRSFIPELKIFHKTAVVLLSTVIFFLTKILDQSDLDLNDNLLILQSRSLRIVAEKRSMPVPRSLPGHKILINKGQIACKGVGAGKVHFVTNDEELKSFPEGAVLVARHTSPRFVTAMDKAGAIITDVGSPIGHMASIAREYGVPTILNTEIAMKTLKAGQEITVDAINGNIYEGRIEQLVEAGKRDNTFKEFIKKHYVE